MRLTESQESLLARIRSAAERYRQAQMLEYELARKTAEERILGALIERDKLVALGIEEGIPLRQIGIRGLGTSNHSQAKRAAEHGASLISPQEVAEIKPSSRYAWDADDARLTVRMEASEFEPYLSLLATDPDPSGEEWDFYIVDGRLTPNYSEDDETWQHPVVSVVMTEQGKRDALQFIALQKEAA
ncbi:hypothetical protein [Streptomyces sp. AC495_CC817]|uniref:hypothetical protein n=1 Tax=Streptomyces sp. AC495_CC817 TaxID=2823900 RepID=UPI001C26DB8E|nr:hypothetical protein [Streptomyces sp. AC495_CC817]